jgi:hypothetical protein
MPTVHIGVWPSFPNDDPSEYAGLPADWPHAVDIPTDAEGYQHGGDPPACPACYQYEAWAAVSSYQLGDGRMSRPTDSLRELSQEYPNRFKAIMAHRRLVHQAKRAAKAREKAAGSP